MTVGSLNGSARSNNSTLTLAGNLTTSGASALTLTTTGTTNVTLPTTGTLATTSQLITTPVTVANGGTGATTLTGILTGNGTSAITANAVTNHGVLLGGASNAVASLAVGATGTVLAGSTGADPSFTATPSVTSITLSGGSALSSFVDWTAWTPTVLGATTAGTTTYSLQTGAYTRIGNVAIVLFNITTATSSGSGDVVIGALPFTISNTANYIPIGTIFFGGSVTWPATKTYLVLQGILNTTTAKISGLQSASTSAFLQIANVAMSLVGTLIYRI